MNDTGSEELTHTSGVSVFTNLQKDENQCKNDKIILENMRKYSLFKWNFNKVFFFHATLI